jgi:hypothetical protein
MNHQHPNQSVLRRFGVATALGALLGAGGLFTLLGAGSPVNALGYHQGDGQPQPPTPPIDQIDDLFPDDDPILDLPTFSIPTDDDGPIFEGPNITIPVVPDDDGPIFDGPFVTIPVIPIGPGDTSPPDDTAPPAEQPPAEQPPGEQPPVEQPEGPTTPPAEDAPTTPEGVAPFVRITSAAIDCAGMVHVTYETGATPGLAPENEHVVMFSPASNPAAVTSQRLFQRPVNGVFTVDLQSPAPEAYRVFVVADFEPANVDGVVLVDEADAAAPVDCAPAG